MTKDQIEARLTTVEITISYLESRLDEYRSQQSRLMMELNRARRLEREELQDGNGNSLG